MKKTLKFLSSVLLIATLGLVNCSKYSTGGNAANGFLIGTYINGLVQSAISGNCAISLNLGSLYAGAILQGAVSGTNFTAAQYESASGSTLVAQGYGSSTTAQATAYALVPYNKKYDAFLNTTSVWTEALRNTALTSQKASTDNAALAGSLFAAFGGGAAAAQANITAFYAQFSTAEKTAMATGLGTNVAGLDAVVTNATTNQINFAGPGTGTLGVVLCLAGGGTSGAAVLTNFGTTNNCSTGSYTAGLSAVSSAYLARLSWRSGQALLACSRIPRSSCNLAGISTSKLETDITNQIGVVNALFTTPECRKGTSSTATSSTRILTAAFAGLDKNRTITLLNGATYQNQTLATDSTGSVNSQSSDLATAYSATEGGTTNLLWGGTPGTTNFAAVFPITLIASKAYPKSSALAALGFQTAFPLATGSTAYPVTTGTAVPTSQTAISTTDATATAGSIPWYGGSNIGFSVVSSCENIGMGSVGPTPYTGNTSSTTTLPAMNNSQVDTAATSAQRKSLTAVNEILYAFSTNNAAASLYASLNGANYNSTQGAFPVTLGVKESTNNTVTAPSIQAAEDSIACNRALRGTFAINAALNVGTKLPVINTASGDGSSTSLLTACIYGGTAASRTISAGILGASSLLNITSCPAAAAGASATFGERGLQSFSTYPNGKAD